MDTKKVFNKKDLKEKRKAEEKAKERRQSHDSTGSAKRKDSKVSEHSIEEEKAQEPKL